MIEAIMWKWPAAQLEIRGEQIFENIVWHEHSAVPMPTEAEINTAIEEYSVFLQNEELNDERERRITILRQQFIDSQISSTIDRVRNSVNIAQIRAINIL